MTLYAQLNQALDAVEQYPITYRQVRAAYPGVMFPRSPTGEVLASIMAEFRVVPVLETEHPVYDPITQNIEEGTPVFSDPNWVQSWNVVPATPEEIAARTGMAELEAAKTSAAADIFVQNFIGMTQADVADYVETNVTDLASAKSVLKKLASMVHVLAKREFR